MALVWRCQRDARAIIERRLIRPLGFGDIQPHNTATLHAFAERDVDTSTIGEVDDTGFGRDRGTVGLVLLSIGQAFRL